MNALDKPLLQWLLLFLLAFTWGSSFILMNRGLQAYSAPEVAALRLLISSVALMPIALYNILKVPKKYILYLFLSGLLGSGIPAFMFTLAQTRISSSLAGMLNSLVPLFTIIIGSMFFNLIVTKRKWLGVLVGLIGAVALLASGGVEGRFENGLYGLLVVFATICYALNLNIIKRFLGPIKSIHIAAFGFLFLGPMAAVYLFFSDFAVHLASPKGYSSLGYITLLSVFGTALAIILFNMLIKKVSPIYASSVTYVIPVFAIMWGVIDGEPFGWYHLVCNIIILLGVWLVNTETKRPAA